MAIARIQLEGVRNLHQASVMPATQINVLFGENGSGKTSFLEAIHLLGLARSFRSTTSKPIISHHLEKYTIFCDTVTPNSSVIGVSRSRQGDFLMKLNGAAVRSAATLAQALPLQLLNQDGFALLEGSPKQRRQFIDWGVFHVEQGFLSEWKRAQRALKQRNHGLRHGMIGPQQLMAWDVEFVSAAQRIDELRKAYVDQLAAMFETILARWAEMGSIQLSYFRGWDKTRSLEEVLAQARERDAQTGFTQYGPHRADLKIKYQGHVAMDVLSRGQQKVVVSALRIAQGYLLAQQTGAKCVYLVDDVASELDENHRQVLCDLLVELDCQVFVTCIDKAQLTNGWAKAKSIKMFHVEQGKITEQ
jgi:DNA replication and repair protein RecF